MSSDKKKKRTLFSPEELRKPLAEMPFKQRLKILFKRLIFLIMKNFQKNRLSLHASALTNITVLSMIPCLAFILACAKGVGFYAKLKTAALEQIQDMPKGIIAAVNTIFDNIDKANFSTIGIIGVLLMVWTMISVLGKIEHSFNDIWGIRKARDLPTKIKEYFVLSAMLPVAFLGSTTLRVTAQSEAIKVKLTGVLGEFGYSIYSASTFLLTPLLLTLAFTYLYYFFPNTKVKWKPALVAGLCTTIIWSIMQWAYIKFQVSATSGNPLYGSLATIPLFLTWLQLSWISILIGCQLCYALQNHATYEYDEESATMKAASLFEAGIIIQADICRSFHHGEEWSTQISLQRLHLPYRLGQKVLDRLAADKLIIFSGEKQDLVAPGRDSETIKLHDVYKAIIGKQEYNFDSSHLTPEVRDIWEKSRDIYANSTLPMNDKHFHCDDTTRTDSV